jgi:hypothetical protein
MITIRNHITTGAAEVCVFPSWKELFLHITQKFRTETMFLTVDVETKVVAELAGMCMI